MISIGTAVTYILTSDVEPTPRNPYQPLGGVFPLTAILTRVRGNLKLVGVLFACQLVWGRVTVALADSEFGMETRLTWN